ncbi:hypothetical protein ACWD00_17180 [Streptomyces viridiviolaceus]
MAGEFFNRYQDLDEDAQYRAVEFRRVTRVLDSLYAAQAGGDDSILTRQRIDRLERLTQALCGFPEQLSA